MNLLVASRAVAPLHGWGGLERATADLCTGLTSRGHRVTLVTTGPTQPVSDRGDLAVVALVTLPWPAIPGVRRDSVLDRAMTYPRVVRAAATWLAATDETFDAAIGMGAMAAAFVPGRQNGRVRRLILNPQGMEEFFGHAAKRITLRPQQRLVLTAARHADYVIATDDYLVDAVKRTLRVPNARITVIPNGIDVARIDALTERIGIHARDTFTLISVARIVPNKGLNVLADALGCIQEQLPPTWHWVHAGDGPARATLEQSIARAGISGHVELLGYVSEAALHLAMGQATLFVHPTRYEGSSLVTLEAMAHALPIIASAAGGIPDKVVPGETGWLVPPGDVPTLADAILEAAKLPADTLSAMGAAGRARAIARFSLQHTLDKTEALIEQ